MTHFHYLAALLPLSLAMLPACGDDGGDDDGSSSSQTSSSSANGGTGGSGGAGGGGGAGAGAGGGNGTWFKPTVNMTWQWQISGQLNASYNVDVYDIDAFENSAEVIADLHQQGRKVICYFSAGTYEPWQADADQFQTSDIGKPLADWPDEKWLDHRSAAVRTILAARLDVAVAKGCDGVEPDNVTAYKNDSGFSITAADQLDFNRWLATEAHNRGMAVALKNDGDQAVELAPDFDFSVNEECHQYNECDQLQPFLDAGKPIFNAEYADTAAAAQTLAMTLCPKAAAANTRTIILAWDLDDSIRVSCR